MEEVCYIISISVNSFRNLDVRTFLSVLDVQLTSKSWVRRLMTELSAKLPISEQQVFGMSGLGMEWWQGKRVLITGHSGFKGSWLSIWLNRLGAQVFGLSLKPKFKDDLFLVANVASLCEKSVFGDILDFELVRNIVGECQPDVVFHMAAQPLVRESYNNPRETFNTNVIGTVNLLDALKNVGKKVAVVVVTTDKVLSEYF